MLSSIIFLISSALIVVLPSDTSTTVLVVLDSGVDGFSSAGVSAYVYENKTSYYRICKLLEKLGVDERSNDELWLIDYDNPVATYNPVVGSDNLPDGYKYDVKVIYTRSRDVFIPLDRRAEIANNAKADLFISVHTNALAKNRTAKGASTWTLGLAKSDANLEVAKRENSVILYESDYQTRYAGFNPNSAESYIIFEFMQDKYMEQSVHLASLVQKQFRHTCKRVDRGVHQAGFLVLKASAMPSILVELGFISTPEEERYLNSEAGANTMAKGIYHAFLNYKREQEIRLTGASKTIIPTEEPATSAPEQRELMAEASTTPATATKTAPKRPIVSESATNDSEITFKIQILTSSKPLTKNDKRLKGLKDVDYYKEKGLYKYTYGASSDYNKVLRTKRTISAQFKDAFIIAFRNGEKMNVNEAIAEFKKRRNK